MKEFAIDIMADDSDTSASSPSSKVNSSPFNIDGEAMEQSSIRVKVLPRALTFYAQDPSSSCLKASAGMGTR